jgi:hypothetical protein
MEDLQSLMACLDDISSKIPDGLYLEMADKMKRVHDHMNGNKPFHEDTFYYSDDDSELDSDDDSDSDFFPNLDRTRLSDIALLRDKLLDVVKKMHEEYKVLTKWEKEAGRKDWTPIKRMTAFRKSQAIKQWCEKNVSLAPGGQAGELIGCGPIVTWSNFWTWKNLVENGLRAIVMEIGTDEEKFADFVCYDELSLETLQKLPAFEKKIYDDYKEECQRKMTEYFNNAKLKVVESKAKMTGFEMFCRERERELRELGAPVFARDYWETATCEFWTGDQMVADGWEARVERRR